MKGQRSRAGSSRMSAASALSAAILMGVASCGGRVVISPCDDGTTECDGVCVDTSADPAHCGACGNACPSGVSCQEGRCGDGPCAPGLTDCGACVDTNKDPRNCGGCGAVCAPGAVCSGGLCQGVACPGGLVVCGGECVDVRSDPRRCGGCGLDCGPGYSCIDAFCTCGLFASADLGARVPQTVEGTTAGATDLVSLSCSPPGEADVTFQFVPPSSGTYVFDTSGSEIDTALGVWNGEFCIDVACGDGAPGSASQVVVDLEGGTPVVVVVSGEAGRFRLNVDRLTASPCEPIDLGSRVPRTVAGDLVRSGDSVISDCNPSGGPDVVYTFTAPAAGRYTFDTIGSPMDTVLDIRSDASCSGLQLGCNDDQAGTTTSRVEVPLAAGQVVLVAVEGFGGSVGSYRLNIGGGEVCSEIDLGSSVPAQAIGNNRGLPDVLAPSCAAAPGSEVVYRFTAPWSGEYVIDSTDSSPGTVLFVLDGGCEGPELACANSELGSPLFLPLAAGQTVWIGLDSGGGSGDYVLSIQTSETTAPCASPIELGSAVPQRVSGSTVGQPAVRDTSCVAGSGPEVVHTFVAPTSRTYTIDTVGSSYDTVLEVRQGSCDGVALACNDDFAGLQSQVTVSLTAGETVFVVVDGFGGTAGDYTLNIR